MKIIKILKSKKTAKIIIYCIIILLCVISGGFCARGDELDLAEETGVEALYDNVDSDTASYLDMADITVESAATPDYGKILSAFGFMLEDSLSDILRNFSLSAAVCIFTSMISTSDLDGNTAELASGVISASLLYPQVLSVSNSVSTACGSISVFLKAAIPIYAGIITFSGKGVTGSTYAAMTLFAAEVTDFIVTAVVLSLIPVMLVLCLGGAFTGRSFGKIGSQIEKAVKWGLGITVTVFSSVTSLQTAVTSNTDELAMRSARLAVSTAVPIVGSALGDALSAVQGGLGIIRSGAGAFGILAVIFIFAPTVITAFLNIASLFALNLICELFELNKTGSLISGCMSIYKLMIAAVFTMLTVAVVSAAILITVIK